MPYKYSALFLSLVTALSAPIVNAADAQTSSGQAAPSAGASADTRKKPMRFDLTLAQDIIDPVEGHRHIDTKMFMPTGYKVSDIKLAGITKEPSYAGKPQYGALRVGNGPNNLTYFVIDEVAGKSSKIYIDTNQNGDLTDDGPGRDWQSVTTVKMGATPGLNYQTCIQVHASWGTPIKEMDGGIYTLLISKREGDTRGGIATVTGRIGVMKLSAKNYPVILFENMTDGIFTVPAVGDMTRPPAFLYIDTDNDAPFDPDVKETDGKEPRHPELHNLTEPFQLDGHWYIARPSASGATLNVMETTAPGAVAAKEPPPAPSKVALGKPAPDFTVVSPDGKNLKLSDFKGKVVVIDFWATWCVPCQAAMPKMEQLYQQVKNQDVVFLSVNVLDEKPAFDKWIAMNSGTKYHFTFGYDPAGKEGESIASSTYEVQGIPTVFVVTRDGTIAGNFMGGNEYDVIKALQKQGIEVKDK